MNGSLSIETTTPLFDKTQTVSNNVLAVQLSLAAHRFPSSATRLPSRLSVFLEVFESYV